MAASIPQIMEGIEARLKTIVGLRVTPYVADQINPPQAAVAVPSIESYRATMQRGRYLLQPQVYILTSAALDRVGQMALAGYANVTGPTSIPAAIEGDRTLGGVVEDCVVDSFRPLGWEEVGFLGYYGGVFDLRVIAAGS